MSLTHSRIHTLLGLGLCALLLLGCAPAAFVGGAAVGGALIYDHRSLETQYQDKLIAHQALHKLHHADSLRDAHLNVAVFNANILLVGQTPSAAQRNLAERLVRGIAKAKQVHNEISIGSPTSAMTRSSDTWITTKIKSLLVKEKGLHAAQIKVITENGVVYLMGIIQKPQADQATEIARHVTGTQKVVRYFELL